MPTDKLGQQLGRSSVSVSCCNATGTTVKSRRTANGASGPSFLRLNRQIVRVSRATPPLLIDDRCLQQQLHVSAGTIGTIVVHFCRACDLQSPTHGQCHVAKKEQIMPGRYLGVCNVDGGTLCPSPLGAHAFRYAYVSGRTGAHHLWRLLIMPTT